MARRGRPGYLPTAVAADEVGPARYSSSPRPACARWAPSPDRPTAGGGGFLGYHREEIFWKDAFDLVHKDDLPLLWFLVSLVMEEPGASESIEVRFRDARGGWTLMDVSVLNVLEAPTGGDTGLVVVNVRHARKGILVDVEMQNGSR